MKLAILSDIHDNIWNLRAALASLGEADALLYCGDLCSPFVIGLLGEGFLGKPIHVVFGNNDGDLYRIAGNAARQAQITLHGELFQGEFDGKRVLANHYPDIALAIAAAGQHDLVCYGHNHLFAIERRGRTLTINPGALMGYEPGGKRDIPATFVVYDTTTDATTAHQVVPDGAGGRRVVAYP
jgi:putative phosphoesterase